MTEQYPSDAELNALSGTTDNEQEVLFITTGEAPYYTSFYKTLYRLLKVARRAGDLRVFKDGDLTFGVRAGKYFNGDTAVNYSQVMGQSLTNNATNYIYLTAAGVLTVNTTGLPTPSVTPHIPLATIVTSAGAYDGRDTSEGGDITDYRGRAIFSVCGSSSGGLNALDWQESVADELDFTAAEPAAPTLGDRYLNTSAGASSETAQTVAANDIEEWNGSSWTEITPTEGACCLVEDRDMLIGYNGSAWIDLGTFANIKDLTDGGNADALHVHDTTGIEDEAVTAAKLADGLVGLSVKSYGATGDGTTDDTAAFAAAIAAAGGKTLFVPAGTYILDNLAVSTDTCLVLDEGATLKHKLTGSSQMINFTADHLEISGGTIDGNKAGHTGWPLIITGNIQAGKSIKINNVKIQNTMLTVIRAYNFGGLIEMQNNEITGQAEHDGTNLSTIISVQTGQIGQKGLLRFNHNIATAAVPAWADGASPGGVFFCTRTDTGGAEEEGNFSTLEAIGNKFYGYGQNHGGNDISPIHFYPASGGARIIGNYFEQCGFCAISAKSVSDFVCTGNVIVDGQTTTMNVCTEGAISYVPGYMAESVVRPRAVIANNVVTNPGGQTGVGKQSCISVKGIGTSYASDVIVANNVLTGGGWGVLVDYATNVNIIGNYIQGATGGTANTENGITLYHCDGEIVIDGNEIRSPNGYGISATTGVDAARFYILNNLFKHTTAGAYACTIRGVNFLKFSGNTFDSTSTAINLTQDASANHIDWLAWDDSNTIIAGTANPDFGKIDKCTGCLIGTNAPNNLVMPGYVGVLYRQTATDPSLWVANTSAIDGWIKLAG